MLNNKNRYRNRLLDTNLSSKSSFESIHKINETANGANKANKEILFLTAKSLYKMTVIINREFCEFGITYTVEINYSTSSSSSG
jgi:hypothetical protein